MGLKLRTIPLASKIAFKRKTPHHYLMNYLIQKANLKFPLHQQFVQRILKEDPKEESDSNTIPSLPSSIPTLNSTTTSAQINTDNSISSNEKEETKKFPSGFEYPIGGTENLPFHIPRTKFGSLPVYTDYRKGRTQTKTILRKIEGDINPLIEELQKVTATRDVDVRASSLEVKGNHLRIIRLWLRALGF